MLGYRWVIEALNDFIQKAGHNEALSHRDRDTACAQIEEFVFIDLAGSRPVGATDVVGENFQARHRVRFGVVAEEKIANFLICVSEVGMRFHADETAESGARAIVERIFVKEIARGVRRDMVLQRARVEFLLLFGHRDRQ